MNPRNNKIKSGAKRVLENSSKLRSYRTKEDGLTSNDHRSVKGKSAETGGKFEKEKPKGKERISIKGQRRGDDTKSATLGKNRIAVKNAAPAKSEHAGFNNMTGERLQKVLAQSGVASRRQAEEMITEGRVKVNRKLITVLGTRVSAGDRIEVDGLPLVRNEESCYFLLHKPVGVITTANDEKGRKNVLDLLEEIESRVYPVGRLDYDTSGLLLLTNDGELTYRLTHPSFGVEKTYIAGVRESIGRPALERLQRGVMLADGKTAPAQVRPIGREQRRGLELMEITIHEGRNRQVRRMCEAVGLSLVTLKRIRFGPILLDKNLLPGKYRVLTPEEVQKLKKAVGLDKI